MRMACVAEGMPLTRSWLSLAKLAPGNKLRTCSGFRMFPKVDAWPTEGERVSTGRLLTCSVVRLWLTSPLSVFSSGLADSTVTDSPARSEERRVGKEWRYE